MINFAAALAALVGMLLVWYFGVRGFVWLVFLISARVPFIGKRHRHKHWDALNRPD